MRSTYKRLGSYIRKVVELNRKLQVELLLGVSVSKEFIPSIANTIGTDMSRYKIVRCKQFAYGPVTSRNSDKVSIALFYEQECIISASYTVFEIIDKDLLLPEYLMMWFRRPEFDRYARFMSHGSVRELFGWEEMCEVELPIPSIERQREVVREYRVVMDRIRLNERLNAKLEEAAQAIYKRWFVEFEFPMTAEYAESVGKPELAGQPYKSSGGEMVYNEVLEQDIPRGWGQGGLHDIAELIDGDRGVNYPSQEDLRAEDVCLFLNTGNVTVKGFSFFSCAFISAERDQLLRKGKLERGDIVLTTRGTVGNTAFYGSAIEYEHIRINSGMIIIRALSDTSRIFIYSLLRSTRMRNSIDAFMSGSAQQHLPIRDIKSIPVLITSSDIIRSFSDVVAGLQQHIDISRKECRKMEILAHLLLCRISKITAA